MGRKVSVLLLAIVLVACCACPAFAKSYTIYEGGNISSTYITYFEDIVAGIPFGHHYVAFRSDQYNYVLITGDLKYDSNGNFTLAGTGTAYTYGTNSGSGYSSIYTYKVEELTSLSLKWTDEIIYSDLGDFPMLTDRGSNYEMLNTLLLIIALLSIVFRGFFRYS